MRTIFVYMLFILFSFTGYGQEELTLDDAIQIALHKNSSLQKSIIGIEGFESNVQASYGNFLPTLGGGANWDWTKSDVKGFGTIVIGGISVPSVATTSQTRNYQWNVGSNWTLFDGLSNFATLSQSQNDLESAEYSLERLKQDIVFRTTSLFYDIMNTQKLLEVKEDNLKWNEKNLETI